jgi:hypothetical protein
MLPLFAQRRLDTFPLGTDEGRECFWTALNFFSDTPDDRYSDAAYVIATLASQYSPITSAPRFGDLVLTLDSKMTPVHAAVYIADGIVFTKNGQDVTTPWILMRQETMSALYQTLWADRDSLRTIIVRQAAGRSTASVTTAAYN